ncbi:hypothetical protein LO771_20950 [Streptacidiphilus sp. ASG 303]|uniref:hypothetical protein n=1 Tax=Streptacidiphilus sp. ASG 303 TaxID=2896847 RepID=UPI001E29C6CD|nr:hypothetical protein [Streptacidiphilus sp. ASG 303]MCD0484793.1 hypothetical protein [Streptacidiphilus sp. ASG 303]
MDGVLLLRRPSDDVLTPADLGDLARSLGSGAGVRAVVAGVGEDGAGPGFAHALGDVLDGLRASGTEEVLLVVSGAGEDGPRDRTALGRRVADAWGMRVLAPEGSVLFVPGGSLFAAAPGSRDGGWQRFSAGGSRERLGPRFPAPSWQPSFDSLPARVAGGCVVDRIPAGVVVRPAGARAPEPGDLYHAMPVDPRRPAVVVGVLEGEDVSPNEVAALLSASPRAVRSGVRLVPGGREDILPLGQAVADALDGEVEVYTGLPLLDGSGTGSDTVRAVLVGRDGAPGWQPFVDAVACRPGAGTGGARAPRLVRWTFPLPPGSGGAGPGVLDLSDRWQVTTTRAGLWVARRGAVVPVAAHPVQPDGAVVEVGVTGERLDGTLWPVLSGLLARLAPEVVARAVLHVHGHCPDGGRELRALAGRHGVRSIRYGAAASRRAPGPRWAPHPALPGGGAPPAAPRPALPGGGAPPAAPHPALPAGPSDAGHRGREHATAAGRAAGPRGPLPQPAVQAGPGAAAPPVPAVPAVPDGPGAGAAGLRGAAGPGGPGAAPAHAVVQTTTREGVRDGSGGRHDGGGGHGGGDGVPAGTRRSTGEERLAFRALAGPSWDLHATWASRTAELLPGTAGEEREAALADLVALRLYLTAADGPLGHAALAADLRAGGGVLLPYAACLTSGLGRLAPYRGAVVRGAAPGAAAAGPPGGAVPGAVLHEPAPVCGLPLDPGALLPHGTGYLVWSVGGRRVQRSAGSSPASDEVVFAPGTRFRVLEVRPGSAGPLVLLRELPDDGASPGEPGGPGAGDRAVLERLDRFLSGRPVGAAVPWPARCAGPLGTGRGPGPQGAADCGQGVPGGPPQAPAGAPEQQSSPRRPAADRFHAGVRAATPHRAAGRGAVVAPPTAGEPTAGGGRP